MSQTPSPILTVDELRRRLTRADPSVVLVPPRILRRVIKRDRDLVNPGLQVPHRKSYVLSRERLLTVADLAELGIEPGRQLPPLLLLLPRPDRQRLANHDTGRTLLKYWRLLFHGRIHRALQARSISEGLRQRLQRLGLTEFDEATAVLRQEGLLLPPGDAGTAYEEFAAVFLELRYFAPQLLPLYFPACSRPEMIEAVLTEDVDAAGLFAATRLEGAADPALPSAPLIDEEQEAIVQSASDGEENSPLALWSSDAPRAYRRLLQRADTASSRGNMVRAAIFRMRAVRLAPAGQVNPIRAAASREIDRFAPRLQKALGYTDADAVDWRQSLFALLEPASRGIWPSESRMLYDLQKACIDRERPVFAVDVVEWLASGFRRPIKRLLPFHDSVRMVKHLRSALHRLNFIRVPEPIRRRLSDLLRESTHQAEHRLRERLRPVVRGALATVGLTPRNIAEEVARDKVVEELIDLVVEHGFFGMSDLRDAIARNRLKLPDLTEEIGAATVRERREARSLTVAALTALRRGIITFFIGDQLLRANRRLAADLDGVYHRGEIYLRWLQRLSAAAFGTTVGRLLTLYVALPFGSAVAVLKVWDEVMERIQGAPPEDSEAAREAAKHIDPYAFTLLGLFFLALLHIAPFRRALLWLCVKAWHGLSWCVQDMPAWLVRLPWVVPILQSRPWLFFYQFIFKPLPGAVLSALGSFYLHTDPFVSLSIGIAVFAATSLLLNSRWGIYLEELATDSLVRTWQLIHADLVPGLVRWLIYLYRRLQEEMDRLIYTVDEWLRFRPGDNRLSLIAKPILGLMWFCATYAFRVIFNLFVEPTFNPIKHFPTVTVAAKLLVPVDIELLPLVRGQVEPILGNALGYAVAWASIGLLPGLAGFLVWEFKENWRLYRANQAPTLRPEIIGHHGETMLRLMRPGLHSGTLPKLFARLRHGRGLSPRKQYEALHHLRGRFCQFVERSLFATLAGSRSWGAEMRLKVGEIHIATNRIRIELLGPEAGVHVDFEHHGGWLLAGLTCPSGCEKTWLAHLRPEQGLAFRDALGGFYKLAGVEVVREQLDTLLPAGTAYDLTEKGLVVWSRSGQEGEIVYDLEEHPDIAPRTFGPSLSSAFAPLTVESVLYSATPIHWNNWVQTWQLDHDGKGHAPLLPLRIRLLLPRQERFSEPEA